MYIEQLYTACLAEAAYYIESEGEAAIIDPLREIEDYVAMAKNRGTKIKFIFETHFHADFVSGHLDLSKETGSPIVYGPGAETAFSAYNATDGEVFSIGKITLTALHTPGHTPESTCYLLKNEDHQPYAIFTGDTLFVGDVGRPDLLDGLLSKEELAGMMYDSLNEKIKPLPDEVIIYPAHGPGSACGKNIGKDTYSTIGLQKSTNYALKATSKEDFIEQVTEGMTPPPAYFFDDARINRLGYTPVDDIVKRGTAIISEDELKMEMEAGALLIDTRDPADFENGFIPGAVNIGLGGQYAVWAASLFPLTKRIALITDPGKEKESVIRLARVGFENLIGILAGGIDKYKGEKSTITSIDPEDYKKRSEGALVIDVRKPGEYQDGHIEGAKLYTLGSLEENHPDLKDKKPWLIYCAGGYRSMIATSFLTRMGRSNLINVRGGFGGIKDTGAPVSTLQINEY